MGSGFELRGIIVPMVTPLGDDAEVDVPSLRNLVNFLIDGGVDGLWVLGATGQFHTLSERQRDLVTDISLESAGGRVPVLVGCIDSSPDRCAERGRRARASGADGIFATAPIFDAVTQAEVLAHYRRIRDAVDLPLVAYNAQYATQTAFTYGTVRTLAEEGTLAGIKDSADVAAFRRLLIEMAHMPDFRIVTGHAALADAALLMGADGCVPTMANIVPGIYASLMKAALDGDWDTARARQDEAVRVERLIEAWGPGSVFGAFLGAAKTALTLMGVIASPNPGRPYPAAEPEQIARIRVAMADLGLPMERPALSATPD